MAKAKNIGWAVYVAGFVIWLFGYLSTGHAAAFDWEVAAPRDRRGRSKTSAGAASVHR